MLWLWCLCSCMVGIVLGMVVTCAITISAEEDKRQREYYEKIEKEKKEK